jgi:hypothetical protein
MGKNEDDTDYGWRATADLRWARRPNPAGPDDVRLEQRWQNVAGEAEWRQLPITQVPV